MMPAASILGRGKGGGGGGGRGAAVVEKVVSFKDEREGGREGGKNGMVIFH